MTHGVCRQRAHLALASAAFSARLIPLAEQLGARIDNDDEREAEALRVFEIGTTCEPPPDGDAIASTRGHKYNDVYIDWHLRA